MYNHFMKQLAAITLVLGLLSAPAHAETTEYDFEIIIFEDTSNRYINSEQWQHELAKNNTETEISNIQEAQQNTGSKTDKEALKDITPIKGIGLKRYANALKTNKRYNVLVHKAWRQAWHEDSEAIDIPIDSRSAAGNDDRNSVHGSIRVVLERYLHIYTDMIYQQPNPEYNPEMVGEVGQPYKQYPIKSHRRMRSKELHYLDHPMVGILVMAMPVEKKTESKESA